MKGSLFKNLNPAQARAVRAYEGPLLILAGAGSGKTRVLTHRIVSLILEKEVHPECILAITFTNKAATEMSSRVSHLLKAQGYTAKTQWISTFHSFCTRLLRRHIQVLNLSNSFTIYDQKDQISLIKKILLQVRLDEKMHPPKLLLSRINRAKTMALRPHDIERKNPVEFMDDQFVSIYKNYEAAKEKLQALDFGDLLLKTEELFSSQPPILSFYQEHFKYVMIDEYQDTNLIQYMIAKAISLKHQNLCVTGDEDQSIYSWRGANIRNILSFKKDFPHHQVVKLEENYRSTQNIVSASHCLIQNNKFRQKKTLFTKNPKGSKILLKELADEKKEAFYIAHKILSLKKEEDYQYKDFAIFYRTNAQSRILEEMMRKNSLPYKIVGGLRFFDRMEIKDIISYLKIISNSQDDLSLRRIINVPTRGIGFITIEKLENLAHEKKFSLYKTIDLSLKEKIFSSKILTSLHSFFSLIETLKKEMQGLNLLDFYFLLLERTKYKESFKKEESLEAKERLKNLEEFAYVIEEFEEEEKKEVQKESLTEDIPIKKEEFLCSNLLSLFLEKMALMSEEGRKKENQDSVSLMTLHIAKGLEFQNVFITGLEDGLLPSVYSWDNSKREELEEERRLLYVGMTRAKKNLIFSYVRERHKWGHSALQSPSCFLEEIPSHFIQKEEDFENHYHDQEDFDHQMKRGENRGALPSISYKDSKLSSPPPFCTGMRVHHSVFGKGSICRVEGRGEKKKISIAFGCPPTVRKFMANSPLISKI